MGMEIGSVQIPGMDIGAIQSSITTITDNINLFINGFIATTDNINLTIIGHESLTDDLNLFIN